MEKRLGRLHCLMVHCQHRTPEGSWFLIQANFDGERDARSYAVHTIVEKRGGTLSDGEFAWTWAHRAAGERGAECQMEERFMTATRNNSSSSKKFKRQLAELEQFTGRPMHVAGIVFH